MTDLASVTMAAAVAGRQHHLHRGTSVSPSWSVAEVGRSLRFSDAHTAEMKSAVNFRR